ncbi:bacteriophage holin [Dyadobacter sp. 22481]|uniref:bacteriophage holin n=1 Tax=Dyadobacter sp. 22481 TaxID=3453926 RepID=UPI003F84DA60
MKHTLNALLATISDKSLLSFSAALAGLKAVFDTYFFDDWFFLIFLLVIIGVDTVSGTYKAWKKKTLESRAYARLFEKLLTYGSLLVMAHVLMNFPIKGKPSGLFDWLDNVLYCLMMVREAISILENFAEINPKGISTKILARLKNFDESGKFKDLV